MKKFVKGDQDIELTGGELKVFIRPRTPLPRDYMVNLLKYIKKNTTVVLSSDIDVIVVSKDGTTKKL